MEETPNAKAIAFAPNIRCAEAMSKFFTQNGVPAKYVFKDQSIKARKAILEDFENGNFSVLFAVDILNEGVDVPDVEVLIKLNRTKSPVKAVQQLGRGLRLAPNKRNVIVLDFVGSYQDLDAVFNLGLFTGISTRSILRKEKAKVELQDDDDLPVIPPINLYISESAKFYIKNLIEELAPEKLTPILQKRIREMCREGYPIHDVVARFSGTVEGGIQRRTVVLLCKNVVASIDTGLLWNLRFALQLRNIAQSADIKTLTELTKKSPEKIQEFLEMVEPQNLRTHVDALLQQGESLEELASKLNIQLKDLEDLME
jgi:hypothetical protein